MARLDQKGIGDKKMCVLINSMTAGGAEKVVATLYPEYQKAGANVSFMCLEKNDVHKIEGVAPVYLSEQTGDIEGGLKKLLSLFRFAWQLRKYVKDNDIDLVQSHIYRANYVNILARLLGARHKVQIVNHGMPSQYLTEGLAGKTNLWLIRRLYPKADQVIGPSQGMVDQFIELGVAKEKSQLIRNPFDLDELNQQATCGMEEGEFHFDPAKKYLIAIGRLLPVKRMDDAIWAYYELHKDCPEVELIILGDGEKWDMLADLKLHLAISKKVHMPGDVENPHKYLVRSAALISASEFEGFSNVIVEALVAGTPVISTDCESGPREILAPGTSRAQKIQPGCVEEVQHGLLIPVGDIKAMVKAMKQLLGDENLQQRLSEHGAARVQEFAKEVIAQKYLEHSRAVLGTVQ